MENRVLTLDEVLALPEGTEVWVEDHSAFKYPDEIHKVCMDDLHCRWLNTEKVRGWMVPGFFFGTRYRVWSLPQPPTPEELAANPWQ